jgi:Xaa-Pro aminopeptidase
MTAPSPMPAEPFPPEVFRHRREQLLARTGEAAIVVPSAPELRRSRDTEVRYRPSTDLYYLTGFPEPGALAVIGSRDGAPHLTLFTRPRDPERETWDGPRLGPERARELFGADDAYPIHELDERLPGLLRAAPVVHYPAGLTEALDRRMIDALVRARGARQRSGVGPTRLADLDSVLGGLRRVKEPAELERMRVAARIAAQGHRAAMAAARPGVGEWEMEAALEGTFRALGAAGPAFPSIVGAGGNATILHYVANSARAAAGDLVLIDAGAEHAMYCSDVTRTFPVSGRFGGPQRDLYEVVLAAEEAAIAACRPGEPVGGVHDAAVRVLVDGMVRLGILRGEADALIAEGAYKRYYMHQTSHWLGLDVHDAGLYREEGRPVPLEEGMVLTVEPGLYLPAGDEDVPPHFRGLGIRIEDDVAIGAGGPELLTRDVPVTVEEIEALLARR